MKAIKKRCCILEMLKEMLDLDMQIKKMLDIHEWQKPRVLVEWDAFVYQAIVQTFCPGAMSQRNISLSSETLVQESRNDIRRRNNRMGDQV